jgi:hypothetical protein
MDARTHFRAEIRFFAAARQYAIYAGGSEQLVQPEGFDFSTFIEEKTPSEGASLAAKSCDALVVLSPNPKTGVEQVAPSAGSRTILSASPEQRSGVAAQLGGTRAKRPGACFKMSLARNLPGSPRRSSYTCWTTPPSRGWK